MRQLIVAFCATYFSARVAARVVVIRFGDGDELKKIAKKNDIVCIFLLTLRRNEENSPFYIYIINDLHHISRFAISN